MLQSSVTYSSYPSTPDTTATVACLLCGQLVPDGDSLHRCRDGRLRDSLGRLPLMPPPPTATNPLYRKQKPKHPKLKALALVLSLGLFLPAALICFALIGITEYFNYWWPGCLFGVLFWGTYCYATGGLDSTRVRARY
jgi:hypothetical protein